MNKINLPGFIADASLYRTNNYYQFKEIVATDIGGQVSPAIKGHFCTIPDPKCHSGFSGVFCTGGPDSGCEPTGVCCTPPPPPPPGCIDQLGDQGCYPSYDGSNIRICKCGSSGTCGPCFHITATVDTPLGRKTINLGQRQICRCD